MPLVPCNRIRALGRLRHFRALVRVQGRYWLRHKLQAALCVGGVALGVALFCAIRLANAGALDAFSEAVDAFLGKATHRITSPAGTGVPDAVFAKLASAPGIEAASPLLQDRMRIEGVAGLVFVLGIDPLTDSRFRSTPFVVSAAGQGSRPTDPDRAALPVAELLGVPGAALIPAPMAERLHLATGGTFRGFADGRWQVFTVAGTFVPQSDQAGLLNSTVMLDVATHQEAFGKIGRLDAIRLLLAPGSEQSVAARLPPGLELERVGRRLDRVETMSHAFRLNLEVLGLFSLLVGAFLILNAATFSVLQREALVAIQRCIGASRRALIFALLLESAVAGIVGGAAGVLLGWLLAQRMVLSTATTLFEVILESDTLPAGVKLTGATWMLGIALGVLVACCGSLLPALEAARVSPLKVLESSRWITGQPIRLRRWAIGAVFGAMIALALLAWPGHSLGLSLAGATAVILVGALLCPLGLWAAGMAANPVLSRICGVSGLLAARQLSRSISRTGLAAASLMVALALALAIGITVGSFRTTFTLWLDQTLTADLYLSPASEQRGARFPVELLPALRAQPFVQDLAELKTQRVTIGERDVTVVAVDPAAFGRLNRVPVQGNDRARAIASLSAGDAWISETLAYPLDLGVGGSLRIPAAGGGVDVPVAAIVQNYAAPNGIVYLNPGRFRQAFGAAPTRQVAIWLRPGSDGDAARQTLSGLPGGDRLRIALNRQLRENALRVFDRTFAITRLMSGLAAAVAFIAVVSASTALFEERRRVHGYLGAIGVKRSTLAAAGMMESGLLALVAGLVSWGTGYAAAAILVFIVNRRAFGWTLQFLPAEGDYVKLMALGVAAALLGSLISMFRLWRAPILAAIREE